MSNDHTTAGGAADRAESPLSGHPSRREFLMRTATTASVLVVPGVVHAAGDVVGGTNDGVPRRRFGRHDDRVSLLCVGGFHIGKPSERESVRIIHEALDNGVNFLDNAWEYHHGESEKRMGRALKGRRDRAFLMTKHHGRDKKMAMQHLEDSLRRLQTDHIDLWQYHEVIYDDDPDRIFAPGGGIEAAEVARKQGKVRYIGFTGHKAPRIHLKMLAYGFPWDAVQLPLNPFDPHYRSFEKWVLPVLERRKIAPLAMKTRGGGELLETGQCSVEELWRYAAALPVATIVSGMGSVELLRDNLRLARTLQPMTATEMKALRERVKPLAEDGAHELYKTARRFDGWKGREVHGET